MLAYAAARPRIAERGSSPNGMLAIIGIHVAVVAVLMSAKMDLPSRIVDHPIIVDLIDPKQPPPPHVAQPATPREPAHTSVYSPPQAIPTKTPAQQTIDSTPLFPSIPDAGPATGPAASQPLPTPAVVRSGPELLTPASELRPPYPPAKLLVEEEAVLKLRLTIAENGRVVGVEPVGRADPVFLAAARGWLIRHWRYRPASEDGKPIASALVITLRFQLDD